MDSKKFFNELRKVIREEVKSVLREVLTETTSPQPRKQRPIVSTTSKISSINSTPSLQDLLNETAESMSTGRTLSFTSQDAQYFDRNIMAEKMGYGDMMPRGSYPIPDTDLEGKPVVVVDEATKNAVTRDYSEIMKRLIKNK